MGNNSNGKGSSKRARIYSALARTYIKRRFRLLHNRIVDDVALVVDYLFVDPLGRSVELGVAEQCRRARVVDDVERQLVLVRDQPRTPADHLLEQRDRPDGTEQDDVTDGWQVDTGRQELRGRGDDRRLPFRVGKVAEVPSTDLALIAHDAYGIVRVLPGDADADHASPCAQALHPWGVEGEAEAAGGAGDVGQDVTEDLLRRRTDQPATIRRA